MRVLGIETSCDETGLAIYDSAQGLLGHSLHSQAQLHANYGGVVPELASRDHIRKITPLLQELLEQTGTKADSLDAIAYTAGPGLMGALLVGATFAKALGLAWGIPAFGIHHMEGHLLAPFLETPEPQFPFTALLVSGGHTLLVDVQAVGEYRILGESIDDAVGEAFDKTAKLLGLGYPGGAALAQLAEQGNRDRFRFPRPMVDRPGLDFSFSGLKTFAMVTWEKTQKTEQDKADIAVAFEDAVVDTLVIKCKRALQQTRHTQLVIAGGVSANHRLRAQLTQLMRTLNGELFFPRSEFCTDNGAMIAYAGFARLQHRGYPDNVPTIQVRAKWPLSNCNEVC